MTLTKISPFFTYWRTSKALDREVVDAVIAPEHVGPSPALSEALREWPGIYYWSRREGPNRLVLIRTLTPKRSERWWLHILLFVVTFVTVWLAGASLTGSEPILRFFSDFSLAAAWASIEQWLAQAAPGWDFAFALMGILLAHELGHYALAKRYHIDASPPFFLPAFPPALNFIGTFGAFIRLRSPVIDRRQLLDVGAAGPWAGMVVAAAVLIAGLLKSEVVGDADGVATQFIYLGTMPFYLGDSLLIVWARTLFIGDGAVLMHPLALAGWFGLFITSLNLLPLGQLDGGHVVFALIGRRQATVGKIMWLALIVFGFVYFKGWWVWAALILWLGRGRVSHPAVVEPRRPIPTSRWPLGIATAILFVVTFAPNPFP